MFCKKETQDCSSIPFPSATWVTSTALLAAAMLQLAVAGSGKRRRMDDNGNSRHRAVQVLHVAYVANEIPQAGVVESACPHFVLLEFIPAEDDQLLRAVLAQHNLYKLLPERTRSPGHQYRLLRPIHETSTPWDNKGIV
jgi:hypothetical protein